MTGFEPDFSANFRNCDRPPAAGEDFFWFWLGNQRNRRGIGPNDRPISPSFSEIRPTALADPISIAPSLTVKAKAVGVAGLWSGMPRPRSRGEVPVGGIF